MTVKPKINIDWEPAPGYVLCRPVDREELQTMGKSSLVMTDDVGKVSDHVGVGEVLKVGGPGATELKFIKLSRELKAAGPSALDPVVKLGNLQHGDLVAFMPYTDKLLEVDMSKYSLVRYDQIMAVLKNSGEKDNAKSKA